MDSDWCTVCGKHIEISGQLYCNQICRQKDQQTNWLDPEKSIVSSSVCLIGPVACPIEQKVKYHIKYHAPNEPCQLKLGYPFHLKLYKKSTAFRPVDQRLLSLTKRCSIRSDHRLLTAAQ